jgi:hypothetical protein
LVFAQKNEERETQTESSHLKKKIAERTARCVDLVSQTEEYLRVLRTRTDLD